MSVPTVLPVKTTKDYNGRRRLVPTHPTRRHVRVGPSFHDSGGGGKGPLGLRVYGQERGHARRRVPSGVTLYESQTFKRYPTKTTVPCAPVQTSVQPHSPNYLTMTVGHSPPESRRRVRPLSGDGVVSRSTGVRNHHDSHRHSLGPHPHRRLPHLPSSHSGGPGPGLGVGVVDSRGPGRPDLM